MLLTITTSHTPATDLGYLLHKNPSRTHSFELSFGQAHVFYPEASPDRCTAALLLDMNPIGLIRARRSPPGALLDHYVNDRPYVASSFLSVAIAQVLGSALAGRSRERPELAKRPIPLQARLAVVPCRGRHGEEGGEPSLLHRLFEPLGYDVITQRHLLDETFPDWGASTYFTVGLQANVRLSDLLAHLYVLIPVLDREKHYWVGEDEVDKLLRRGAGWLARHPERELIAFRYLKGRRSLAHDALARLVDEESPDLDQKVGTHDAEEAAVEERVGLNQLRLRAVIGELKNRSVKRVLDLGCGTGRLLQAMSADRTFEEIVGVDVSYRALEIAADHLHLERSSARTRPRLKLIHGALTYRDQRLVGYDAAAVVEVIEHLDPFRRSAFERVVFEYARPKTIVLTTPNVEYNPKFEHLLPGSLRHKDHRFEWTRAEFQTWAKTTSQRFGYSVHFLPIGTEDPIVGAPTQMAIFTLQTLGALKGPRE